MLPKTGRSVWWATGYNVVAIPLAAGILYRFGILLSPAMGAVLMAASTVIVAINARFLRVERGEAGASPAPVPGPAAVQESAPAQHTHH